MSSSVPRKTGISRLIAMALAVMLIGALLFLGWQPLVDSGVLVFLVVIGVIVLVVMLREAFNFVTERLGLWVRGESPRVKEVERSAESMAGQISRKLKTQVQVASMEDTGKYIHVMLNIGADEERLIQELVVIPYNHMYNPDYWDQMTQGIINYNRERISAPA